MLGTHACNALGHILEIMPLLFMVFTACCTVALSDTNIVIALL